jgi:uncharacterized lipoprotein YmbA
MMAAARRAGGVLGFALLVAGCAGPPLTLYTLASPDGAAAPFGRQPVVIAVARVAIPDALDTEDILVRDGTMLRRSSAGRWASRLSLGITDLLTGRLAARRPDALVTDQPQLVPVSARLMVDVAQWDVTAQGEGRVSASWTILPTDPALPPIRGRVAFSVQGATATDQDVVRLEQHLAERLAGAIDLSGVR